MRCEHAATTDEGCHNHCMDVRRWKDSNNIGDDDGLNIDGGAGGLGGHVYKVIVRYIA